MTNVDVTAQAVIDKLKAKVGELAGALSIAEATIEAMHKADADKQAADARSRVESHLKEVA